MLFDWRTVAKNIALPLEMLGWDRARRTRARRGDARARRADRLRASHHPWQLSGGMQQRVSIARALVVRAGAAPDGRAVRRARRDDARAPEHGAAPNLAGGRLDGRLRHALDLRGGVPLDARRRDVARGPAGSPGSSTIDLPQPRTAETREDPRFFELVTEVREALAAGHGIRRCRRAGLDGRGGGARRRRLASSGCRRWSCSPSGSRLWQGLIDAVPRAEFLLPKPSDIAQRVLGQHGTLWHAGWYTFKEALGGFVIGGSSAILVALAPRAVPAVGAALMPFAIAANAVPIIAFAPITNAWFGAAQPALEDGDRRRPLLLPGACEHAARPDLGATASIELMRSYAAARSRSSAACAIPNCAAVHLRRPEGRGGARDDRRDRRRVLRRLDQRARRADPELDSRCSTSRSAGPAIVVASAFGIALYASSRRSSVQRRAGIRRPVQSYTELTKASECREAAGRVAGTREGEPMNVSTWCWARSPLACTAARDLGRHCKRRAEAAEADQGHPAAQVGDAGAVRRLLRGARPGLLQEGRARREDQGRRPEHHAGAGRRRRAGRLRPRLAAEPVRDTREGQRARLDRAGVRAQRA